MVSLFSARRIESNDIYVVGVESMNILLKVQMLGPLGPRVLFMLSLNSSQLVRLNDIGLNGVY